MSMGVDVPGRTTVRLKAAIPAEQVQPGAIIDIEITPAMVESLTCIDCNFTSGDIQKMFDHQEHGRHTWIQRIKRWLS